jgi:Fic family protein
MLKERLHGVFNMKPYLAKKLPLRVKLPKKLYLLEKKALIAIDTLLDLDIKEEYIPYILKEESFFSLKRFNTELTKEPFYRYCSKFSQLKDYKGKDFEEIVHYYQALDLVSDYKGISKKLILSLHETIKKGRYGLKQKPFFFREHQNWIGKEGCLKEEAYFFPPAPHEIKKLMSNLILYINSPNEHPCIQLAIAFAQFLIIHPFMDGNGRVARAMIPFFFKKKKMTDYPILFLSEYFQKYRLDYFHKLYFITHANAWEDWIEFFLKGIIFSIERLKKKIKKMTRVYNNLRAIPIKSTLVKTLLKEVVLSKKYFLASKEKKKAYKELVEKRILGIKKGSSWVTVKSLLP